MSVRLNDLRSSEFWLSDDSVVMVNDRDPSAVSEAEAIGQWLSGSDAGGSLDLVGGHLLFATSGSTGSGKWVALSKEAMLASARAVNEHLGASDEDVWLLALPDFHVGGVGVFARCFASSCGLVELAGKWSGQGFYQVACEASVTLSALVPTQLVDLVNLGLRAPASLRALLIGGGRLDDRIYQKAVALGWPVVETYGMTETCSQVATAELGSRSLRLLPLWQAELGEDGRLRLQGEALMSGYVSLVDSERGKYELVRQEDWYVTSDVVELAGDSLVVIGRADRCVKILGELVNLAAVECALMDSVVSLDLAAEGLSASGVAVVVVPHLRMGYEMVLCCTAADVDTMERALAHYHLSCAPFMRVRELCTVGEIPQSALGKVRYAKLTEEVRALVASE